MQSKQCGLAGAHALWNTTHTITRITVSVEALYIARLVTSSFSGVCGWTHH